MLPRTAQGSGRYVAAPYRWRLIEGAGHFPHEERPEVFDAELHRLAGRPGARPMTETGTRDGQAAQRPAPGRLGRPLPHGGQGVERVPDDYAPSAGRPWPTARRLLDEGRPFNAHEVFEGRWKCAPEEERELWQGLAQICVGLTHLQRGNGRGAAGPLRRGADRIPRTASRTRRSPGRSRAGRLGSRRRAATPIRAC